jgi:ABC-type multidrug transport system fused ATPase/permease subunit
MARSRFNEVEEKDKKPISKASAKNVRKILGFILPYKGTFITGFIFLILSGLTSMTFPFIAGQLVDSVQNVFKNWSRNEIALGMFGVLIFQATFSYLRVELFTRVSEKAMRDIRIKLYSKMMALPIPFIEQRRVGELTSRLTSDVTQLQDILSFTLAEFVRQITTVVLGIVIIFWVSAKLSLVMLIAFPFIVTGGVVFGKFIRKLSKKVTDDLAGANTVAEESLQSIHSVKAFTNESYEVSRYYTVLQHVVGNSLKAARYRGMFISFVILSVFGGIVLVLWYGLGLVEANQLTIGKLVSFILYTTFIAAAAGGLGDLYGQIQKTIGASERIIEIIETEDELEAQLKNPALSKDPVVGFIEFDNVRFAYPSRPEVEVLQGLNLTIKPGQKIALVGQSGAGKSTIVQLLMRYYQIKEGGIRLDGKSIENIDIQHLRHNIGIVPQEVLLFGGSIEENIRYGKPEATRAEIEEAAQKANAWEFISSFPEGLETRVGERGIKLSGGQRQRIAIARAILKDPAILVLDEATSSLDSESERLVQDALDKLMENRTTIIIAHRLATVRKADRIFVIQKGVITEEGSHLDLLDEENGLYSRLVKMQFEIEE